MAGNSNQNGRNSNLKNMGNEKVEVEGNMEGNIILPSTTSILKKTGTKWKEIAIPLLWN